MVNANILIFTGQDEVWTNTKDPINPYQADVIFAMTVLRTFLPLEASKAMDRPWLQKALGQGQIRPRLPLEITAMLMQAVQAQVAEALEDEVQVVDMVLAPAQQQQRGRQAPTATITRAQAKQQQQQQMTPRSQTPAAMSGVAQVQGSPPQTDRELKLGTLLAKYKMALDMAYEDLRTAVASAMTVVALNEELTTKLEASERKQEGTGGKAECGHEIAGKTGGNQGIMGSTD